MKNQIVEDLILRYHHTSAAVSSINYNLNNGPNFAEAGSNNETSPTTLKNLEKLIPSIQRSTDRVSRVDGAVIDTSFRLNQSSAKRSLNKNSKYQAADVDIYQNLLMESLTPYKSGLTSPAAAAGRNGSSLGLLLRKGSDNNIKSKQQHHRSLQSQ